jgi:hypothetical protein
MQRPLGEFPANPGSRWSLSLHYLSDGLRVCFLDLRQPPEARWPHCHKAAPAAAAVRKRRRVGRGDSGSVIGKVIGRALAVSRWEGWNLHRLRRILTAYPEPI